MDEKLNFPKDKAFKSLKYIPIVFGFAVLTLTFILAIIIWFKGKNNKDTGDTGIRMQTSVNISPTGISSTEIPSNFPKDFPIYAGAKLISSYVTAGGSGKSVMSLVWDIPDSLKKVKDFYKKKLSADWNMQIVKEDTNSMTLSFKKENIDAVMGIAFKDSKSTIVSLTITLSK